MSYDSERYQANKQKLIEGQMKYYKENRDEYIEYMRDYNKLYYQANRERIVAKQQVQREERAKKRAEEKANRPCVRKAKKIKEEVSVVIYVESPYAKRPLLIDKGNFVLSFG